MILPISAMTPGLLPALALAGMLVALLVVPILVLGPLISVLPGPPAVRWLLSRRHRARPRS